MKIKNIIFESALFFHVVSAYFSACRTTRINMRYNFYSLYEYIKQQARMGENIYLDDRFTLIYKKDDNLVFRVQHGEKQLAIKITKMDDEKYRIIRKIKNLKLKHVVKIYRCFNIKKEIKLNLENIRIDDNSVKESINEQKYLLGSTWIFMEYLEEKLVFYEFRNQDQVFKIAFDIFKGLNNLHKNKILHCDLKLDNIMGTIKNKYLEYKIIDFDCAKEINEKVIEGFAGTFNFMAPEVFYNSKLSKMSDIFSFGAVLYYLMYNERHFHKRIFAFHSENCRQCEILKIKEQNIYKKNNSYAICSKCKNCKNCNLQIACILCESCSECKCMNEKENHGNWEFLMEKRLYKFYKIFYELMLELKRRRLHQKFGNIIEVEICPTLKKEFYFKMIDLKYEYADIIKLCLFNSIETQTEAPLLIYRNLKQNFINLFKKSDHHELKLSTKHNLFKRRLKKKKITLFI